MLRLFPTIDGWHAPANSLTAADVQALTPTMRQAFDAEMTARAAVAGFVVVQWGVRHPTRAWTGRA